MMPQIDTKLTIGNLIQICLLLFAMAMAWSRLATKDEVAQGLEAIKKEYVSRELNNLQLQVITNQVLSVNGKVDDIQKDLKEIKRWVK